MRAASLLTLVLLVSILLLSFGSDEGATDVLTSDETTQSDSEKMGAVAESDIVPDTNESTDTKSVEEEIIDDKEMTAEGEKEAGEAQTTDSPDESKDEKLDAIPDDSDEKASAEEQEKIPPTLAEPPVQTGPFIDLLGETLLSLEMIDEGHAQLHTHYTNEILSGKKVIGLYFSADWCGPCRQFTPDLVNFYNKMNSRRGKENEFEIVWISRCRDFDSFGQYFTQMNWLAMPPEEAMGQRGQKLSTKYKVKGIPTLVLLDEVGNVITKDGRNKIPMDKAGIGFPWRNPIANLYVTLVPKTLRFMLKSNVELVKEKIVTMMKAALGAKRATA